MNAQLGRFLEVVTLLPKDPIHRVTLEAWFGKELLSAAIEEGLFTAAGESDRYPCSGGHEECPRRVVRDAKPGAATPHYAGCTNGMDCENIYVSSSDLETMAFSAPAWWGMLQRMLDLDDQDASPEGTLDRTWNLGTQIQRGAGREVLAVMGYRSEQLALELAAIRERYGRTLALMPLAARVSPELIRTHRAGAEVELAFLQDRLRFDDGRLWWRDPKVAAPEAEAASRSSADTFCVAYDGKRYEYSRDAYHRAIENPDQLDLIIDITESHGAVCKVGRRGLDGKFEFVPKVSLGHGKVLGKLILWGKPTQASRLRLGQGDHEKYVERARALVDVKEEGRRVNGWRWFKTVGSGMEREIQFNPDPQYRYLLLCRPEFAGPRPKATG